MSSRISGSNLLYFIVLDQQWFKNKMFCTRSEQARWTCTTRVTQTTWAQLLHLCIRHDKSVARFWAGAETEETMIRFHAERLLIYKQLRELNCLQGSFCCALKYDNDGGKIPSLFMAKGLQWDAWRRRRVCGAISKTDFLLGLYSSKYTTTADEHRKAIWKSLMFWGLCKAH